MNVIHRYDSSHPDFRELVALLDADLAVRDGDDTPFYAQYNGIEDLKHTCILYLNDQAVGCGAFKQIDPETVEIKRMFVLPEHRGKGLASQILSALESWADELSYRRCILETGKRQPEAIRLYEKNGYARIPNYGPYIGIENSVCFEKQPDSSFTKTTNT